MRSREMLRRLLPSKSQNKAPLTVTEVAGGVLIDSETPGAVPHVGTLISEIARFSETTTKSVIIVDDEDPRRRRRTAQSLANAWTGGGELIVGLLASDDLSEAARRDARTRPAKLSAFGNEFELHGLLADLLDSQDRVVVGVAGKTTHRVAWVLDEVFSTGYTARDATSGSYGAVSAESGGFRFRLVPGSGAVVDGPLTETKHLVVPPSVAQMGTVWVNRAAFAGKPIQTCYLAAPMRSIGQGAFFRCRDLRDIVLANTIEHIGRSAFAGCRSLDAVELPTHLRTLGPRAFRGCESLRSVRIPNTVSFIGSGAFDECDPSLTLIVERGSFAEAWAIEQGVAHSTIDLTPREPLPRAAFQYEYDGFTFRTVPGGALELTHAPISRESADVVVPGTVNGLPVRGVAGGAFPPDFTAARVTFPSSLRWVASGAISSNCKIDSIVGLKSVAVFGESCAPPHLRRRQAATVAGPLESDNLRLSLRMICSILGTEVPKAHLAEADTVFTELSASRLTSTPGALFFGKFARRSSQRVNYLAQRGVRMFASNRQLFDSSGAPLPCLLVDDPAEAYAILCRWIANHFPARRIAITGSVGKTTAKEFVRHVCMAGKNTLYSRGNQNGTAQIGRNLQRLTPETEVLVQETGASRMGSVKAAARLLEADAFVVTNIGMSHIEKYEGRQENILLDKVSHDRYLQADGVAFLNFDDPLLRSVELEHRTISYAVDNQNAAYFATDIRTHDDGISFSIVERSNGRRTPAVIHAVGEHNVLNAILAFAVGRWLGIRTASILRGLAAYRSEGVRQNLIEIGGQRIFADCYNASLESVASALKTLGSLTPATPGTRHFVFADIAELGEHTESVHAQVANTFLAHPEIQRFYCYGPHSAVTAARAEEHGLHVFHSSDRDELHAELRKNLNPEDIIAFKGSHGMALAITIDTLFGSDLSLADGDMLLDRAREVTHDRIRYRIIRGLGAEMHRLHTSYEMTHLEVGGEVEGAPLYFVGPSACGGSNLTSARILSPVRTLATSAFFQSRELRQVSLPDSLRVISRSALNGCGALEELVVPEGVTTIGYRAMYDCRALSKITLPSTLKTIEAEAFARCPQLTISCPRGSIAHGLLQKEWPGIPLELTEAG